MQRHFSSCAAALLAFSTPVAAEQALPPKQKLEALETRISQQIEDGSLPSVAIAVVQDRKIVRSTVMGEADREGEVNATAETKYGIASLGKSISALGALALVQQGALTLDKPLTEDEGRTIFGFSPCGRYPTLRQLLSMTGGVPHGGASLNLRRGNPLAGYLTTPIAFCPGDVPHYSNFSIHAVEQLAELRTGTSFARILKREVFEPIGMKGSGFDQIAEPSARAIRYDRNMQPVREFVAAPATSRGMHTTLTDITRYMLFTIDQSIITDSLLEPRLLDEMHNYTTGLPGSIIALGWGSFTTDSGRPVLISNGDDIGVQATVFVLPDEGFGVAILINKSGGEADELAFEIADLYYPGLLQDVGAFVQGFRSLNVPLAIAGDLHGNWIGELSASGGVVPIWMDFSDNVIRVSIAGTQPAEVSDATQLGELVSGSMDLPRTLFASGQGAVATEISFRRSGKRIEGFLRPRIDQPGGTSRELPLVFQLSKQ